MFKRIGILIGKAVRDITNGYRVGRSISQMKHDLNEAVESDHESFYGHHDGRTSCPDNEPLHNHHDGCPACDMPK